MSLWKCKWDECVCWVQVWVASVSVSKCCKVWPSIFIMYLNNDKCWKLLLKTQFIIIHNIYSNCNTTLSHFKTWDRISSNLSSYHFRHEFKIKFILHSIWTYQNTSYNIYFWYFTTFLWKTNIKISLTANIFWWLNKTFKLFRLSRGTCDEMYLDTFSLLFDMEASQTWNKY